MQGAVQSEAVHAPTEIVDARATRSVLSFTVPPSEVVAETLSRFDPRSARRSSLMRSLEPTKDAASPVLPERYELGALLGEGGMGVVRSAKDLDLAREVALKQLKATQPSSEIVQRFLREAQVTAQLEHPGIVPVHDVGADESGRFYYIMRLVRGDQTLRRVIDLLRQGDPETHRTFTLERRVKIVQQVALILHYAHSRGVVHRDVKPENIMLGPYGEVYLLDWGLAKVAGAAQEPVELSAPLGAPGETGAGRVVGTPLYMAPEQASGGDVSPRTDVYSLSAVLYEVLSLHHYLGGHLKSLQEVLDAIKRGEHLPAESHLGKVNGRVPRFLSAICDKGLEKDPNGRYSSAQEIEQALQSWSEGETPVLCPATLQLWLLNRWKRALVRRPAVTALSTFVFPTLGIAGYLVYRVAVSLVG